MPQVSIITTFHNEQLLAHTTLLSIARMRKHAYEHGITTEHIAIFDKADDETKHIVKNHPAMTNNARIIEVNNGDAGISRYDGVTMTKGDIISITDGDDYYSENWIERHVYNLKKHGDGAIMHAEILSCFEATNYFYYHRFFSAPSYFMSNYGQNHTTAFRTTYINTPYHATRPTKTGFAHPDYHWNCETVARGYTHRISPQTIFFYRDKKSGSLYKKSLSVSPMIPPTNLFDPTMSPLLLNQAEGEER